MNRPRLWERSLAALAVLALQAPTSAPRADAASAALHGVIRGADRAPLAGARLLAAPPSGPEVRRSEPTAADGGFRLEQLAPGPYRLAVEVERGLYLVRAPLDVVAGVDRPLEIAVGPATSGDADPASGGLADLWNDPLTAGALVLGVALVVGVLVKNATDDESSASEN